MYWTREVVQCSLKLLFDLFMASMLNYKGKLFKTAFTIQDGWITLSFQKRMFFLETSEIS